MQQLLILIFWASNALGVWAGDDHETRDGTVLYNCGAEDAIVFHIDGECISGPAVDDFDIRAQRTLDRIAERVQARHR